MMGVSIPKVVNPKMSFMKVVDAWVSQCAEAFRGAGFDVSVEGVTITAVRDDVNVKVQPTWEGDPLVSVVWVFADGRKGRSDKRYFPQEIEDLGVRLKSFGWTTSVFFAGIGQHIEKITGQKVIQSVAAHGTNVSQHDSRHAVTSRCEYGLSGDGSKILAECYARTGTGKGVKFKTSFPLQASIEKIVAESMSGLEAKAMAKQAQITRVATRFVRASDVQPRESLDDVAEGWERDVGLAIRDKTGRAWKPVSPGVFVSDIGKIRISMSGLNVDITVSPKSGSDIKSRLKDPAPEEIGGLVADALGLRHGAAVRTPSLGRRRNSWIRSVMDILGESFDRNVDVAWARSGMGTIVRIQPVDVQAFTSNDNGCWFGDTNKHEPFNQSMSAKDFADRIGEAVLAVAERYGVTV